MRCTVLVDFFLVIGRRPPPAAGQHRVVQDAVVHCDCHKRPPSRVALSGAKVATMVVLEGNVRCRTHA